MFVGVLLVGSAGAQTPPAPQAQAESAPAPPPSPDEIWGAMTPRDVLHEVVARRRIGDYKGASERLEHLSRRGVLAAEVAYHRGVLAEVQEEFAAALEWYGRVLQAHPGSEVAADAAFRRAYCLEDLGRHKEALVAVRALERRGQWDAEDARVMALQRGIVELRSGKKRRGIRRILRALQTAGPSNEQTWIRAKARIALVRAQLEQAAELALVGNRKAARRLRMRARLMASAEAQAKAAFGLGEPEFALEGLLLLGDAYLRLYEDILDHPPPRKIAPSEHAAYRAEVRKKSAILRLKAHARYDEGVRVAARTLWQGSVTEKLKARRDATAPQ
jgi:tetratricopeptide (TPR) repeat protein